MQIIPAILTQDPAVVKAALDSYRALSRIIHVDVLDDTLVSGRTLAPEFWPLNSEFRISWHLMVAEPERYLDDCLRHATSEVIVHAELGVGHLESIFRELTKERVPIGLAINPATPVQLIASELQRVQSVQVMTVEPGRQGGEFLADQLPKLAELRVRQPNLKLAVDGGINPTTIHLLAAYRPDRVVVGSFLAPEPQLSEHWQQLQRALG